MPIQSQTIAEPNFEKRCKQMLQLSNKLFATGPSWTEMQNGVFGVNGPFSRLFPTKAERTQFLCSDEYAKIQAMLKKVEMETNAAEGDEQLPSGKFLVRIPQTLHAALQAEAEREGVSLNQLALAKLSIGLGQHASTA